MTGNRIEYRGYQIQQYSVNGDEVYMVNAADSYKQCTMLVEAMDAIDDLISLEGDNNE